MEYLGLYKAASQDMYLGGTAVSVSDLRKQDALLKKRLSSQQLRDSRGANAEYENKPWELFKKYFHHSIPRDGS